MSRKLLATVATTFVFGSAALAEAPSVAVDIAPLHSLVSRVMAGVGEPDLVIPSGASPHDHRLRPSEAAALESADVVFWMGEGLTPWMADALETLAADAKRTAMMDADGTLLLDFRENAVFEAHEHGAEKDDHDDRGHEDHGHDGHDHADEDHADASHDDHAHGAHDPHAWLSPDNAATWLNVIAADLSATDPGNAGVYFANAAAARSEIDNLKAEISAMLDPLRGKRFIVFHDAYQYFETAFDISAAGAISLSDASDPSPARIAEIQARVREEGIDCVLAEPQFNPGIIATVLDGTEAATAVLDPVGADIAPGPEMYPTLLRNLAEGLADCL